MRDISSSFLLNAVHCVVFILGDAIVAQHIKIPPGTPHKDCCISDPTSCLACLGKQQRIAWTPTTCVENLDKVLGSQLWPDPALANVAIWELNQWMEALAPSLSLFLSLFASPSLI